MKAMMIARNITSSGETLGYISIPSDSRIQFQTGRAFVSDLTGEAEWMIDLTESVYKNILFHLSSNPGVSYVEVAEWMKEEV